MIIIIIFMAKFEEMQKLRTCWQSHFDHTYGQSGEPGQLPGARIVVTSNFYANSDHFFEYNGINTYPEPFCVSEKDNFNLVTLVTIVRHRFPYVHHCMEFTNELLFRSNNAGRTLHKKKHRRRLNIELSAILIWEFSRELEVCSIRFENRMHTHIRGATKVCVKEPQHGCERMQCNKWIDWSEKFLQKINKYS